MAVARVDNAYTVLALDASTPIVEQFCAQYAATINVEPTPSRADQWLGIYSKKAKRIVCVYGLRSDQRAVEVTDLYAEPSKEGAGAMGFVMTSLKTMTELGILSGFYGYSFGLHATRRMAKFLGPAKALLFAYTPQGRVAEPADDTVD